MKKITKISEKATEVFYPSISDAMREINKYKDRTDDGHIRDMLDKAKGYSTFYYFDTFPEAESALLKGDWELGKMALNNKFILENKNFEDRKRQKAFYDVVGFQASVPRYLQGLPTNMVNSHPVQKQEKTITIVKHIGYIGDVTAAEIIENSAKALTILNQIEKMGIRCNLDIYSPASDPDVYGNYGNIRIRIKNATERLAIGQLAFPLANSDMLRRFIFGLRGANRLEGVWDIFRHYSRSEYSVTTNKKFLEAVGIKNCIFLNNFIDSPEQELRRNGLIK